MSLRGSINYVWRTQDILGEGATGKIFKGVHKTNGAAVAVKTFNQLSHMRPMEVQMREFEVLKKVNHENIVKLLAIEDDQEGQGKVIVMELCTGGSLFNILNDPENTYGLSEEEFLLVLEHLSAGMKHLRDNNLVHRDLKPGNIMKFISEDGRTIYKLIDFGGARELEENQPFMSLYGTEEYLHPDMYEKALLGSSYPKTFTANVDLWSMGITLYQVATGNLPFQSYGGRRDRKTMHFITTKKKSGVISGIQEKENGPINWSSTLPNHCQLSEGLQNFVTPLLAGLLEDNSDKMWTFDQFFEEVSVILNKRIFHLFFMNQANPIKILLAPDSKFDALQEYISVQSKVTPENQYILFDNDKLESKWNSLKNAAEYPVTEVEQPIFLYNRDNNNVNLISSLEPPSLPKFPNRLCLENDATLAKVTCSVGHEYKRRIEKFTLIDDLMKRSVQQFIEPHKIALNKLLEKTSNLNQSLSLVMKLLQITSHLSKPVKQLIEEKLIPLKNKFVETFDSIRQLHELCTTNDLLRQKWRLLIQDKNSLCENRHKYRAKYLVECLRESWQHLLRDRSAKNLTHNAEQFHALEKIKMTNNGERLQKLLDDAQSSVAIMAESMADWYKLAQTIYLKTEILDADFQQHETKLNVILNLLSSIEDTIIKDKKFLAENGSRLKDVLKNFEAERKNVPNIIEENNELLKAMVASYNSEMKDMDLNEC